MKKNELFVLPCYYCCGQNCKCSSYFSGRWKNSHSSLIKNSWHLPKCFRSASATSNHQLGVCKSIKKSLNSALPHKASFKSKSDNCLHKINTNNPENKKTFGQKVANAFASLHLSKSASNPPSSSCTPYENQYTSTQSDSVLIKASTTSSLERNISFRTISEAEQAKRTRSLERNHRHLVTIDSTCR